MLAILAPICAWAECPGADRLQEALLLLVRTNPVLLAGRELSHEQARKPAWSVSLSVGYSITDTLESGEAGPNAAIRLKIPLWDNTTKIEAAKERAAAVEKEDAIRVGFLAAIQSMCEQAYQVRALDASQQFARDRLAYRQERVKQGIDPSDLLWEEASSFQSIKHQWEQEAAKLATHRLMLARQYGGDEWERLNVLLEAMTR